MQPLISVERLKQAKKVLYMSHMAIGDFVFQGACLQAFHAKYPQIQLDLWIDDCRNKNKSWHTGRNNTLSQWIQDLPFISNLYPIAESNEVRLKLVQKAQQQQYDVIFFIGTLRLERYAKIARQIGKNAFVVGARGGGKEKFFDRFFYFSKLDGWFPVHALEKQSQPHISAIYRDRFAACIGQFNDQDLQKQLAIHLPDSFLQQAKNQLQEWLLTSKSTKSVLINHLSTSPKRDLGWSELVELIIGLRRKSADLLIVLNVPPDQFSHIQTQIDSNDQLKNHPVCLYTATEHFYQLPAMIASVDWVLTVETAIMHLASTLQQKQLVLMRETDKEWQPVHAYKVLFGKKRVNQITVQQILSASESFLDVKD